MLINASHNERLHAVKSAQAAQKEKMRLWVEDQTANCMFLADPNTSPANELARIGKPMTTNELELKLKKLNPSLHFEFNEFLSSKKMMYLVDRRGKTALFPYESGLMPERSIMNVKVEMVPRREVFSNENFRLERKDLGKMDLDDPTQNSNPYLERVVIPWSERTRGWRTILIKLVISGHLSPQQVEAAFGAHQSPEWQNSLGKAKHQLPW